MNPTDYLAPDSAGLIHTENMQSSSQKPACFFALTQDLLQRGVELYPSAELFWHPRAHAQTLRNTMLRPLPRTRVPAQERKPL